METKKMVYIRFGGPTKEPETVAGPVQNGDPPILNISPLICGQCEER